MPPSMSREVKTAEAAAATKLRVTGTCHVLFAYDVGFALDLAEAERRLSGSDRPLVRRRRGAPTWFQYEPAPLRVSYHADPIAIDSFTTEGTVTATVFDFGAASVAFRIPFDLALSDLVPLAGHLYDSQVLLRESRRHVESLLGSLGPAVQRPHISDFYEDYVIYCVNRWQPADPAGRIADVHRRTVAALLQAEDGPLSEQQVTESLAAQVTFSPDDLAIVDWNAALLLDADPEDGLALLEFANLELLEMRYLDNQLDHLVEQSHAIISRQESRRLWAVGPSAADLRRLGEIRADASLLIEGLHNAFKLVGDQYLARLHRSVAQKLHLAEWDASVNRKLSTVDSIYGMITQYQTTRRLEILEIIIIVLIAVSIVIPFIPGLAH